LITTSSDDHVYHLVVDPFIEVLDKNVALAGLAEGGVALGQHDPAAAKYKIQRGHIYEKGHGDYHARFFIKE
jgi:hypothetical protein